MKALPLHTLWHRDIEHKKKKQIENKAHKETGYNVVLICRLDVPSAENGILMTLVFSYYDKLSRWKVSVFGKQTETSYACEN